jgi:group I intron endonuclease
MGWIYEIKNIENGKSYIGQTTQSNVATRWAEHFKSIKTEKDTHLIRAFRKHGFEKFIFKVICETINEKLDERETEEIMSRNTLSPNGYNLKNGGSRGKHSIESIEKIKNCKIGTTHSDETKEKLRKLNLGKIHTAESKEKTRIALSGKTKTPESIEKSAIARTGLKRSIEICEKMKIVRQKPVEQWSIDGIHINTFCSIKTATTETGCNDISKCCKGKYKQSGGFIWKYKDQNNLNINEESCNT